MRKKLSERLRRWIKNQKCTGATRGWHYLVVELAECVEALERPIEAVEPEKHTCGDCGFFDVLPCDKGSERLQGVYYKAPACGAFEPKWEQRCRKAGAELAKANTTIDVLRKQCHTVCGWKGRCEKGEQALAQATAEIERLRQRWAGILAALAERRATIMRLRTRLKQERDEAKAVTEKLRKERDGYRADLAEELRRREHLILAKVAACDAEEAMQADAEIGRLVRGMQNDTGLGWEDGLYYVLRCHYPEAGRLVWYRQESGAYSTDPAEALRAIQNA